MTIKNCANRGSLSCKSGQYGNPVVSLEKSRKLKRPSMQWVEPTLGVGPT